MSILGFSFPCMSSSSPVCLFSFVQADTENPFLWPSFWGESEVTRSPLACLLVWGAEHTAGHLQCTRASVWRNFRAKASILSRPLGCMSQFKPLSPSSDWSWDAQGRREQAKSTSASHVYFDVVYIRSATNLASAAYDASEAVGRPSTFEFQLQTLA